MPGFFPDNEYDLAGFCVGVVEKDRLIDGSSIHVGDQIIGLASSGLHSNGFSLARKVLFEMAGLKGHERLAGLDDPIGLELLKPTHIYVKPILNLLRRYTVKGIVHITGGGFIDNIPRIVPTPCKAVIHRGSWSVPPIFSVIQELGAVDEFEMLRVFNMGIGLMLVVSSREGKDMVDYLNRLGETACLVGTIEKRAEGDPLVAFV
jgi:phosphoribosylformylglycinamidine cyclo-ligase